MTISTIFVRVRKLPIGIVQLLLNVFDKNDDVRTAMQFSRVV